MATPQTDLFEKVKSFLPESSSPAHYNQGEGAVRYMNAAALDRPLTLPRKRLPIALGFAVVAAAIGIFLAYNVLGSTMHAAERAAATTEENLAREVSYDMPSVASYAGMDAATIKATLDSLGLGIYTVSTEEDIAAGKLEALKLPADVSVEEAAVLYAGGVSNLDAPDAALLLNGSWQMQFDSANGYNLAVRYADFDSGNVDTAVEAAIQTQGFDSAAATPLDVDEAGNTFRSGTVDTGAGTYNWRISAIALSEVYDISGLPETAIYVGIRLTSA